MSDKNTQIRARLPAARESKGTGHNKFVRKRPTLSGVEGLSKTPLMNITNTIIEFIGSKI